MRLDFTYAAQPTRVRFAAGAVAELATEVDRLGLTSVLVLCTPGQREAVTALAAPLGERCAGVHAEARRHVPAESAQSARSAADRLGVDGLVAIGGGSAIGLAKAVALTSGRPIVAVPTTYAGSEQTTIWGLTEGSAKRTGRDPAVLPATVVYDPELTVDLPVEVSVTSGFNAMAHAVEALYAPDGSPVVSLLALEGLRSMASALPGIVSAATDLPARSRALYAAWLCGGSLGATTMSLHHKLCHVLGGLDLPHAPTHTVVLPYVLAYNAPAVPEAVAQLREALTEAPGEAADEPATALWRLAGRLGAPRSLAELGLRRADLEKVVDQVMAAPYANPRPVHRADLDELLDAAWSGAPP